jgi:hypothetical protein
MTIEPIGFGKTKHDDQQWSAQWNHAIDFSGGDFHMSVGVERNRE